MLSCFSYPKTWRVLVTAFVFVCSAIFASAQAEQQVPTEPVVPSEPALQEEPAPKFTPTVDIQLRGRLSLASENSKFGVKCDFLRVTLKSQLTKDLSLLFRQRLNKAITNGDFMSATDYLYLAWIKNGWELSGGKHWIACGGFEYQATSYDIYIPPIFYDGLGGMYNYVVNAARYFGKDRLCLQVSNSLYSTTFSNLLGYSLLWSGRRGVWEYHWSVNFFERAKGDYNQYFCLGNRFHTGPVVWDLGLAHRMDLAQPTFFKDFSAVAKLKYTPFPWMAVFGKATWDYKECIADPMLPDDTNIWQAGGGFEFFPFKSYRLLRLHCVYFNRNGSTHFFLAGLSCQVDFHIGDKR